MSNYQGFNKVELRRPERSNFDLSHEKRLSTQMGKLTPILMVETMPNDSFTANTELLLRLAPTLAPVMHRINAFIHYFFVPNRLLWEEWEEFITAGRLGDEEPIPPYLPGDEIDTNNGYAVGGLADYLGIPTQFAGTSPADANFDAMPFAAYYKVWYDYYRDRNFVADNELLPLPSGFINLTLPLYQELIQMRYRNWQHDYFTSALPFTQRGQEVLMPLSGAGSVTYLNTSIVHSNGNNTDGNLQQDTSGGLNSSNGLSAGAGTARIENIDEVNLTSSSVSINDLRQAVRLQEWYERNALAGSRYNESVMAHFGVFTGDARIQRAEYLGGGKVTIKINEVVNTAWSTDSGAQSVPAGNLSGHAIAYSDQAGFKYRAVEHGFIVGILSVMPVSGYMQGVPRMFRRKTFLDYPWPSFAHLGEQPVWDWEIYANNATMTEDPVTGEYSVFGYQSRYADWKHMMSTAHGEFRESLEFWHLTRKFDGLPTLGAEFNALAPDEVSRIFAVYAGGDNLWVYLYNDLKVKRSLPYFGTPML